MRLLFILLVTLILACSSDKEAIIPDQEDDIKNPVGIEGDTTAVTVNNGYSDENASGQVKDTISFLALGDSYTIGTGEEPENKWPVLFSERLKRNGYHVDDLSIIATNGWTTKNLLWAINRRDFPDRYDMVSLLIGVNNQYQGLDFSVFEEEFLELLSFAQKTAKSNSGIIVLSIPDYGVTPFGQHAEDRISKEIDQYNEYIQNVCNDNNIKFYNITEISRKAKNNLSYLAPDNLHPSKKMYEEWISLILSDPPVLLEE